MVLDDVFAMLGVGTEPSSISGRAARDTSEVRVGAGGVCLGISSGGDELCLLAGRTAVVGSPLVVDTGDSEGTKQLDLNNILNGGVEAPWGTISTDVGEDVRRLDGVVSSARSGEVVCSGD